MTRLSNNLAQTIFSRKRLQFFKIIGQFVAKAMLDSRIIDLSFNKIFLKLVLGEEVPLKIATLKAVDEDLGNSLARLQLLAGGNGESPSDKVGF
jgi:E3 ubiquitin-protein ligase TRIP12